MASIISAGTTSGTSLNLSGDTSGVLQLATNGSTTAVTVDTSQRVGIGTSTTTDAGVTITTNVTRDGTWNAKLALQSTGSGNYPGLFFTGCSGSTRYSVIAQTASTSGDDFKQTTHQIMFVNNSSTSGDIRFDINGNVGTTNPTERMRINSNGNIALQGATLNASGVGITFPATQSASSDANCLDDYEEGTWTPTDASGAGLSFTSQNGYYTKIGNMVYLAFRVTYPSTANGNSGAIGGFPFNTANLADAIWGGYVTYTTYTTAPIQFLPTNNGASTAFFRNGNTNGPTNAQMSGLILRGVIIYQTST